MRTLKRNWKIGFLLTIALTTSGVLAQKTTEMYIPIGQSPGLSNKLTWIGQVAKVDAKGSSLTITTPQKNYQVKITNHTQIWLDRSELKMMNQEGNFSDCKVGLLAEVKPLGEKGKDQGIAEWIKIKISKASN